MFNVKTKAMRILFFVLAMTMMCTICVYANEANTQSNTTAQLTNKDFIGKTFAATTGTVYDMLANDFFKASEVLYVQSNIQALEMVRAGKAEALMLNTVMANQVLVLPEYQMLTSIPLGEDVVFPEGVTNDVAVLFNQQSLTDQYNEFLKGIKADGTLEAMLERWVRGNELPETMPDIPLTGENGTLTVAITGEKVPFDYVGNNGEPMGLEVEHAQRFAQYLGMDVKFELMDFGAIIPYVVSGKADMGASDFNITAERQKSVIFGDPYFVMDYRIIFRMADFNISDTQNSPKDEIDYTDFIGESFGILLGTGYEVLAENMFNAKSIDFYGDTMLEMEALRSGNVNALLGDLTAVIPVLRGMETDDLTYTAIPAELLSYDYAAITNDEEIVAQFNEFLPTLIESGMMDEMKNRWIYDFDPHNVPDMPDIPLTGENGVLRVSTNAGCPPFVMLGNGGECTGFEIELMHRFAQYIGKSVEIFEMDYNGLLPHIKSGKSDICAAMCYADFERMVNIFFTDGYHEALVAVIHRKDFGGANIAQTAEQGSDSFNFIEWVKKGVRSNLITENRWKMIVDGLLVTLKISLLSQIFGTMMGCLVCFMLTRKNKFVLGIVKAYNGIIHGTPMVVLLMVSYYIIFGKSDISAVLIAVAAFTLVEGVGIGEKLFTAISTIDPVEIEAARSMGFSSIKAFANVTLPQAVKIALPGYMNGFVELVKSTAIVGYIAIQDLSRAGDIIRSRTYDAYFPLLFVALIYLLVTTACVQIFKVIIRRVSK